MDSPSFVKQLSPTKTPLFPTSPERINQQVLASSFSSPSNLNQKASDVQARIAFINNLSRAGSPATSPQHASTVTSTSAALQRAMLGREEAETALLKATSMLSEAQSRERRISERLESLLEELQSTRERQAHERTLFEKEVRKARKEAFRAGSLLVKAQEELKLSRGEIKNLKDEVRTERESKERAKQDSFERAYALAGMSEELQSLKDQLRATESNNQQSILESQIDDMEGDENKKAVDYADQATCTTPAPRRPKRSADAFELKVVDSDAEQYVHKEETPTKKIRLSRRFSNKENHDPTTLEDQGDLIIELKEEIKLEQRRREKAEDMVHFMKMECQFKRCSCRIAESQGLKYIHDKDWDMTVQHEGFDFLEVKEQERVREETPTTSAGQSPIISPVSAMTPPTPQYQEPHEVKTSPKLLRLSSVAFCAETGTFVQVSPPHAHLDDRPSEEPLVLPNADYEEEEEDNDDDNDDTEVQRGRPSERASEIKIISDAAIHHSYESNTRDQSISCEQPLEALPPSRVDTEIIPVIEESHQSSQRQPITPAEPMNTMKEESVTKRVPTQFESRDTHNPSNIIPGTPLTREEALAQIRARRGRTRSTQRSASANEATSNTSGMKVPPSRRIPGMKHSDTKSESDIKDRRETAPVSRR